MRTTASKNAKKLKLAMRQSTVKRNEASAPYKAKPESASKIKKAAGRKAAGRKAPPKSSAR